MKSLHEIKSILKNNRERLFSKYPIKSLAIFGSYSTKTHNEHSDLDLLIEFNDKIGIRFVDLANELENLFGFKVDLVSRNGIKEKYFNAISSDLIYV